MIAAGTHPIADRVLPAASPRAGANGALPGFRNFANDDQVNELAAIWNVEPLTLPGATVGRRE